MNVAAPESRSWLTTARYQPLIPVCAAACFGIIADRFAPVPLSAWWLTAALSLVVWHGCWRRRYLASATAFLLAATAATFAAWHHAEWHYVDRTEVSRYAPKDSSPVCLRGEVVGNPHRMPAPRFDPLSAMRQGERTRMEMVVTSLRHGDEWRAATGNIIVLTEGHLLNVKAGDEVRIVGQWNRIAPPDNPGEFDRQHHYRAEGVFATLYCDTPDCVTRVSSPSSTWGFVAWLRSAGEALLWRYVGPERAGLAAAMFLGIREELDPDASEAFLETGAIHLLVVSGMNVAIFAGFLVWAMRFGWLPERWAMVGIAVVAVVYALVTDSQPPVVRATVMVCAMCLSRWWGVRGIPFNTLALAAIVVLALNPAELFRAGMQLSFLSFATLVWASNSGPALTPTDPLARHIAETRPWPHRLGRRCLVWMLRAAFVSGVIWLAVLPAGVEPVSFGDASGRVDWSAARHSNDHRHARGLRRHVAWSGRTRDGTTVRRRL